MKSAQDLMARIGGNMRESMGADRPAAAGASASPAMAALHGETTAKYQGAARIKDALSIEVERIIPDPDQPRKEFDPEALADLAASLKARGQLQPIRVRWDESGGRWVVVVGERRYRAALLAGLPALMCVEVKGSPTPDDILEDQLVENALRQDLRPIEQARAFRALIDRRGWSYRQLAESLHIAPASVARALALLELPGDLQGRVESGELAPSVAYEVSKVEDPERQREVASRVVAEGLTRSEAVDAVRQATGQLSGLKGRGVGKGKAKKVTARAFRTAPGPRVTVEFQRGLDASLIRIALRHALDQIEAELATGDQAAA